MTAVRTLLAGALLAVLCTPPLAAQAGRERPRAKPEAAQDRDQDADVGLRVAREYYARSASKPKPLPPGIARNLAQGKPLPPGIARTRMPDDLIGRLPRVAGREWTLVGEILIQLDDAGVVARIFGSVL